MSASWGIAAIPPIVENQSAHRQIKEPHQLGLDLL